MHLAQKAYWHSLGIPAMGTTCKRLEISLFLQIKVIMAQFPTYKCCDLRISNAQLSFISSLEIIRESVVRRALSAKVARCLN